MSEFETGHTAPPAAFATSNDRKRLRILVFIGLPLIVAAIAYNRYDASRPLPPRPTVVAAPPAVSTNAPTPPSTAPQPDLSGPVAELRAKIQQNPKDVASRTRLAALLDQQGNGSDAEDVLREALQQGQKHPDIYHTIGMVYLHHSQYRPAAAAFSEEIKLRPKNAEAHIKLGQAYSYGGNPRGAEQAFETARKLDPSLPDIYLGLAFLNNTSDRYPYAVRYINEFIKRSKDPGPGYALLCRVYINMNAHEKAIEAGNKAVQYLPENPNVWYNLGQAYFYNPKAGQLEKAASAFAQTLKRAPNMGHAHFELASVLSRMGKHQDAVGEFREAVRCEPWQGRYHYQLGRALIQTGAAEEGKQVIAKAQKLLPLNQLETKLLDKITVSPQDPQLRFELARVYKQLERYDAAKTWFQATLDVAPNHPQARQELEEVTGMGNRTPLTP